MTLPARYLAMLLALSTLSCAGAHKPPPAEARSPNTAIRGLVREGTPDEVNIALARERAKARAFEWAELSADTLSRAKKEGKYVLLDGAAEWCHWCHVMDAVTYTDPEIGRILNERFIAIRVDIDERPDIAERYGDWGWPATILFSPDAEEIGKYRGFLPPEDLREILSKVLEKGESNARQRKVGGPKDTPPPPEAMGWLFGRVLVDMDAYYDPREGGWGRMQKAPIGENIQFELIRAARGDESARDRAVFSLSRQRALIDPVWGGIYQYSAGRAWDDPHYEKLMTYQAENLEAAARAFALTKDEPFKRDAELIVRYITTFLTNDEGAFLPAQDADVGSHDPGARFVDGHVYYALGDTERRALGIPRVDPHVYPYENGLAIIALLAFHEATGDKTAVEKARRAADVVLRKHVTEDGLVRREGRHTVRYLVDAASFGRALVLLHAAKPEPRFLDRASKIAEVLVRDFASDTGGDAFFDHTRDPAATGVFAERTVSLANNVLAARFLLALAKTKDDTGIRDRARKALMGASTPRATDGRGRMLGGLLLALDEAGFSRW